MEGQTHQIQLANAASEGPQREDRLKELVKRIGGKDGGRADERSEFVSKWSAAVVEEGLTDDLLGLLADGFAAKKAHPLFEYLHKRKLGFEYLDALDPARPNKSTVRVYLSLLGLELAGEKDVDNLAWLMRKIPEVSYTQNGNTFEVLPSYVMTCVVDEVARVGGEVVLPAVCVAACEARSFAKVMEPALDAIRSKKKLRQYEEAVVKKLAAWVHGIGVADEQTVAPSPEIHAVLDGGIPVETPVPAEAPVSAEAPSAPVPSPASASDDSGSDEDASSERLGAGVTGALADILASVDAMSSAVHSLVAEASKACDCSEKRVEALSCERDGALSRAARLSDDLAASERARLEERRQAQARADDAQRAAERREESLAEELRDSRSRARELEAQVADLQNALAQAQADLAASRELADMLDRDRAKQGEEAMRRLSGKLGIEYEDFRDAESLPMTVDLGENMRLQLKNVFNILKSSGAKL